jgi:Alw26I/Eco31I/Esp3I family type II restriction endonuclease
MHQIVEHPNYAGMPATVDDAGKIDWTIPSNRKPGSKNWNGNALRRAWWAEQATAAGISLEGQWISAAARRIHPLQRKPCQTCGRWMSIQYVYPTKTTLLRLRELAPEADPVEWPEFGTIFEILDVLADQLGDEVAIVRAAELFDRVDAQDRVSMGAFQRSIRSLYVATNSKRLSPGAMSNAPDRLDGFHTYNRCCRASQDTGRSHENLDRYVVDRRAYEQWAEGDWVTADLLMHSAGIGYCSSGESCPSAGRAVQLSADHVGPISLGFRHSPNFIPLCSSCNSAKNNRMSSLDVLRLVALEDSGEGVVSWQAKLLWDETKAFVATDADALLLSRLMRINQDAYLRYVALGAMSDHPEAMLQFLDISWAEFRVRLIDVDPQTLTYRTAVKERRQTTYAASRASRVIRIAFDSAIEYAAGVRNLHSVGEDVLTVESARYEAALRDAAPERGTLEVLGAAISNRDKSVVEAAVVGRISQLRADSASEFPRVGQTLRQLMEAQQTELVKRYRAGEHRTGDFAVM